MHHQLAFPPLTPASGMSTQELRVPTTYQAGPHTDQRGTPSGSSAMNAMYAGSEDRRPRQRSGSKDRHHRDRGSPDDRHRRHDSEQEDRYHRRRSRSGDRHPHQRSEPEAGHRRKRSRSGDSYHHSDDRHRHESGSMSSSLSSSQPAWQSRPGHNYPAFPGSRVVPTRQLNAQMTAYQRMLKFGSADPPKLTKNTLESVAVDTFIKYLHQLIRADAFDDSVIINLIDSETIGLLTYYFQPTETAREHPITHHWTIDWDVATIIQALEELYPLQLEHRHLDRGSRWLQVVADSRSRVRILADNMDQVRRDTINEWNSADTNVGPIPYLQSREVLKDLARCFTNRSNPWHNDRPNVNFQRDLNLMIEADREYLDNPTLPRLCAMVAELIFRWERLTHESSRMWGVNSSGSAPPQGKYPKGKKSSEPDRHHKAIAAIV